MVLLEKKGCLQPLPVIIVDGGAPHISEVNYDIRISWLPPLITSLAARKPLARYASLVGGNRQHHQQISGSSDDPSVDRTESAPGGWKPPRMFKDLVEISTNLDDLRDKKSSTIRELAAISLRYESLRVKSPERINAIRNVDANQMVKS